MDQEQLKLLEKKLHEEREELLKLEDISQAASETVELDQTRQGRLSRMDALQNQALSQALNQRRQQQLRQIQLALKRIDSGDFGFCRNCGEEIAIRRLQLDPSILLCVQCASQKEA